MFKAAFRQFFWERAEDACQKAQLPRAGTITNRGRLATLNERSNTVWAAFRLLAAYLHFIEYVHFVQFASSWKKKN